MAEIITHSFVSAKTQSPDTTLVSKNEWNDGHVFSGGINGQILTYDNTQPNNIRWTDGVSTEFGSSAVAVSTSTPLSNLALINFTAGSTRKVYVSFHVSQYASTGAAAGVITLVYDGSDISGFGLVSGTGIVGFTFVQPITAGAHSYSLRLNTTGNVNVLTFTGYINLFMMGS